MGWYRWSIRAPPASTKGDVALDSNTTSRTLTLFDTSPSLLGTLSESQAPDAGADLDIFVPESQFQGINSHHAPSTPTTTGLTLDYIVQTSLRQRKIRTVDRITLQSAYSDSSPVRSNLTLTQDLLSSETRDVFDGSSQSEATSPRRLFATSPNLAMSTPIFGCPNEAKTVGPLNYLSDMINAAPHTQTLFDSPRETGKEKVVSYSGHSPVFLPASFEQLNIGCIISDAATSSTSQQDSFSPKHSKPREHANMRSIAVQTMFSKKSRFRSTPPSFESGNAKRKRVDISVPFDSPRVTSSKSTGSILSSLENGKLEKKNVERSRIRVFSTPTVKYDIPPLSPKTLTPLLKNVTEDRTQVDMKDVVWARWKPDRPHCLVPADLLGQSGSSTRNCWKARLHLAPPDAVIILRENEFIRILNMPSTFGTTCRLFKKPDVPVIIQEWKTPRIVIVRDLQTSKIWTVPSRHIFLDNPSLLQNSKDEPAQDNIVKKHAVLNGLAFLVTCGSDKKDQMERASILAMIRRHGGRAIESIPHHDAIQHTILLATEPKRTYKYLMAIVLGLPRVSLQWLIDAVELGLVVSTSSPNYLVDECKSPLEKPLIGQSWSITPAKSQNNDQFRKEFSMLLEALGADVPNSGRTMNCTHELCDADKGSKGGCKRKLVSSDHLVDCIFSGDFSSL